MPPRTPARQSKPTQADLSATAPGLVKSPHGDAAMGTLTYNGETYKLSEENGVWPLLQFARVAESGMRTTDMRGLAAIHAYLQDVIDPEDWGRFQDDMINKKFTDIEGLMKSVQQAVEAQLERIGARAQAKAEANGSG